MEEELAIEHERESPDTGREEGKHRAMVLWEELVSRPDEGRDGGRRRGGSDRVTSRRLQSSPTTREGRGPPLGQPRGRFAYGSSNGGLDFCYRPLPLRYERAFMAVTSGL